MSEPENQRPTSNARWLTRLVRLGLRRNPRPDTSHVSRVDAIGWVSAHAICGVPEAAKIEEEIRRLQKLARRYGASKAEIFLLPNV